MRWVWHLAGLFVVLLGLSAWVGFDGYFFVDESALYGQVHLLDEGRWKVELPVFAVDPQNRANPMFNNYVVGGEFAPFAKHPVHALIATGAAKLGDFVGVRVLSILATVVAAGGAGALAARRSSTHAAVSVWRTGLASPLVLHSNLVVAHTLGAAVAAWAFVLLFRAGADRWVLVALAGLGVLGGLLRTEFVLLGAAVLGVAVLSQLAKQPLYRPDRALAFGVPAMAMFVVEPRVTRLLLGGGAARPFRISSDARDGAAGRLDGLGRALLDPGYLDGVTGTDRDVLVAGVALTAAVVLLALRRPWFALPAFAVSIGFAWVRLADPSITPSITWAYPALLAALVAGLVARVALERDEVAVLTTVGVFLTMVVVTQYSVGGAIEWGWRFAAGVLPVLSVLVAIVLVGVVRPLATSGRVIGLVGIAAVSALVPLSGLRLQQSTLDATHGLLVDIDDQQAAADASFIVTTDNSIGRFAWRPSTDGQLARIRADDAGVIVPHLADLGHERMLYIFTEDAPSDDVDIAPFRAITEPTSLGGTGYRFVVLDRG